MSELAYEPDDYDTVEQIAALAAPIFELHGWRYGSDWRNPPDDHVPSAEELAAMIQSHYNRHREGPLLSTSSGRFVLVDEDPHDGTPVLHVGIRVFLDLGELPPVRGDKSNEESA